MTAPRAISGIIGISGSRLCIQREPGRPAAPAADIAERVAIAQFDGQIPRHWAEGLARLDPDRPPHGFGAARWLQVVNDAGLLLDRWGSQLDRLGWEDHDLWACDPAAPERRVDLAGLALAVSGRDVLCVTANTATIKTTSGTLTYNRRPRAEPRMLLWDLQEAHR